MSTEKRDATPQRLHEGAQTPIPDLPDATLGADAAESVKGGATTKLPYLEIKVKEILISGVQFGG